MKAKKVRAWAPVDDKGDIWVCWTQGTRATMRRDLDLNHAGWRQEGVRIARVEIREVERKRKAKR